MIKHLYIECTHTASSDLNTGIQRVVRKIIAELGGHLSNGAGITLVTIEGGQFYRLDAMPDLRVVDDDLPTEEAEEAAETLEKVALAQSQIIDNTPEAVPPSALRARGMHYLRVFRAAVLARISWAPLHKFLSASRHEFGLSGIIYLLTLRVFLGAKPELTEELPLAVGPKALSFASGDVILMLDSSWHLPAWEAITKAKKNGAGVIAVIYDLIPITHPQFCEQALCDVFNDWFQQGKDKVDGYISISQTVRASLDTYVSGINSTLANDRLGYFYLGADVVQHEESARAQLVANISRQDSYLIVSTIEPRKNHRYLIDAFSELWRRGYQLKLHIVGRVGWKVDELLARITEHPEFNRQLFLWHDLDDGELVYCYKNSKSLVFPSYVEGFGLPIIEAQHHQLAVLASDTPIHREVGGDSIGYFDLDQPSDLVSKIIAIEEGAHSPDRVAFDAEQFTWGKSAEMLSEEIYRIGALL
ncbi:hypothetical protein A9Q89_01930 [Gammaproteobacteria bacterium 53_120_T64]|nr:hypothetical protein A9Q89_01930 [Gammaproteobacteria bacterium 53_120_T64]